MTVLITRVRTTLRVSIKLIITHVLAWLDSLENCVKQVNKFSVEKEILLRRNMANRNEIESPIVTLYICIKPISKSTRNIFTNSESAIIYSPCTCLCEFKKINFYTSDKHDASKVLFVEQTLMIV